MDKLTFFSKKLKPISYGISLIFLLSTLNACTNVFFQPMKTMLNDPEKLGLNYKNVYFNSIDGLKLNGWWFPAQHNQQSSVLFLHGNGENISTHFAAVNWLTKFGYNVFIFDYRGYGRSQGQANLKMIMTDIEQALNYINQHTLAEKKLYVIAQSLGASMGIYALSKSHININGVIFISPFSDYRKITQNVLSKFWLTWPLQWPLSLTINNEYNPLDFVSKLPSVPILYMYSKQDRIIPTPQVKALFDQTSAPKYLESVQGGHSSILGIGSNRRLILEYLKKWDSLK